MSRRNLFQVGVVLLGMWCVTRSFESIYRVPFSIAYATDDGISPVWYWIEPLLYLGCGLAVVLGNKVLTRFMFPPDLTDDDSPPLTITARDFLPLGLQLLGLWKLLDYSGYLVAAVYDFSQTKTIGDARTGLITVVTFVLALVLVFRSTWLANVLLPHEDELEPVAPSAPEASG